MSPSQPPPIPLPFRRGEPWLALPPTATPYNVCTGKPVARPQYAKSVDQRATMPPPTQNIQRPAAFRSPSVGQCRRSVLRDLRDLSGRPPNHHQYHYHSVGASLGSPSLHHQSVTATHRLALPPTTTTNPQGQPAVSVGGLCLRDLRYPWLPLPTSTNTTTIP